MVRVPPEQSIRPGEEIESFGVGMIICSLIALLILNGCLCYAANHSELPIVKANRISGLTSMLVPFGLVALMGAIGFFSGGIHSCLLALPLALGNYAVVFLDFCLIASSAPGVPLTLRILVGIAIGVFALGHLLVIFAGPRRHISDLPK